MNIKELNEIRVFIHSKKDELFDDYFQVLDDLRDLEMIINESVNLQKEEKPSTLSGLKLKVKA